MLKKRNVLGEIRSCMIGFRVNYTLKKKIEAQAAKEGMTKSEFIERIIVEHLRVRHAD